MLWEKRSMWCRQSSNQARINKRHPKCRVETLRNDCHQFCNKNLLIQGVVITSAAILVVSLGGSCMSRCIKPTATPLWLSQNILYRWKRLWKGLVPDPFPKRALSQIETVWLGNSFIHEKMDMRFHSLALTNALPQKPLPVSYFSGSTWEGVESSNQYYQVL